jgi:AcrR family transcriptional regulator
MARSRTGGSGSKSNGGKAKSKGRELEIIDAAAKLFRDKGYADTSIQDIADSVGILKGSLYYYIESKEDLLFRVLSDTYEAACVPVAEVREMTDVAPLERLKTYIRKHIEFNTTHLTKIAIYYHDFNLVGPKRRKIIVEQRRVFETFIAELVAEASEAGEVDRAIDPKVCSYLILGTMNGIYTWFRPGGYISRQDLAELASEIIINGVDGARLASSAQPTG